MARSAGRVDFSVEGALGKATGDVRRALALTVVRSNALCLLKQLSQLSPNARHASERHRVTQALETRFTATGSSLSNSPQTEGTK